MAGSSRRAASTGRKASSPTIVPTAPTTKVPRVAVHARASGTSYFGAGLMPLSAALLTARPISSSCSTRRRIVSRSGCSPRAPRGPASLTRSASTCSDVAPVAKSASIVSRTACCPSTRLAIARSRVCTTNASSKAGSPDVNGRCGQMPATRRSKAERRVMRKRPAGEQTVESTKLGRLPWYRKRNRKSISPCCAKSAPLRISPWCPESTCCMSARSAAVRRMRSLREMREPGGA